MNYGIGAIQVERPRLAIGCIDNIEEWVLSVNNSNTVLIDPSHEVCKLQTAPAH